MSSGTLMCLLLVVAHWVAAPPLHAQFEAEADPIPAGAPRQMGERVQDSGEIPRGTVLCITDSAAPGGLRPIQISATEIRDESPDRGARQYRAPMELHPKGFGYAASLAQLNQERIKIVDQEYVRWGPPRPIEPRLLVRIGERRGASVFIERGTDIEAHPEIVYLLTPECRFAAYRSLYWAVR